MRTVELKITRIGNSQGIRIPAEILKEYGIGESILLERRPDEIVLRRKGPKKLSYKETFAEMAAEKEGWSEWDGVISDGLDED